MTHTIWYGIFNMFQFVGKWAMWAEPERQVNNEGLLLSASRHVGTYLLLLLTRQSGSSLRLFSTGKHYLQDTPVNQRGLNHINLHRPRLQTQFRFSLGTNIWDTGLCLDSVAMGPFIFLTALLQMCCHFYCASTWYVFSSWWCHGCFYVIWH